MRSYIQLVFQKLCKETGLQVLQLCENLAWSIYIVQVSDGWWWLWFSSGLLLRVAAWQGTTPSLSPTSSSAPSVVAATGRVLGGRWDVLMGNSFLRVSSGPLRHPLLMHLVLVAARSNWRRTLAPLASQAAPSTRAFSQKPYPWPCGLDHHPCLLPWYCTSPSLCHTSTEPSGVVVQPG